MTNFLRGSEWRRWDLHVHTPYSYESKYSDWATFYTQLKEKAVFHDVEVVGINDYFTVDGYEAIIQEHDIIDKTTEPRVKLSNGKYLYFFPVIELRLENFADGTAVNIHIVFNPKINVATIRDNFLEKLNINYDGITLSCKNNDLIKIGYASVKKTAVDINLDVSKISLIDQNKYMKQAMHEIVLSGIDFKDKAEEFRKLLSKSGFTENDFMIIIANKGHGGLSDFKWIDEYNKTGRAATIRKNLLHISDICFTNSDDDINFLLGNNLPRSMTSKDFKQKIGGLKPSIWGSDAHEPKTLLHPSSGATKDYTWIKADPVFDGLKQISTEPSERVKVQELKPDEKEPYKVISSIRFTGSPDFPTEEIVLNQNLCSVIGSRSSGKSALLAYVAHSIDPDEVTKLQKNIDGENIPGPAAGKTWAEVSNVSCEVEWASGKKGGGKVVYVPQNYLYTISNRPTDITNKIMPVMFMKYTNIKIQYDQMISMVEDSNDRIGTEVDSWFNTSNAFRELNVQLTDLGDKKEILSTRDSYQTTIDELKNKLNITDSDIKQYQKVVEDIFKYESRIKEIASEKASILPFVKVNNNKVESTKLNSTITLHPSIGSLPTNLAEQLETIIQAAKDSLGTKTGKNIFDFYESLDKEEVKINVGIKNLKEDNKGLIELNKQNEQLSKLISDVATQNKKIQAIETKEALIEQKKKLLKENVTNIQKFIKSRSKGLSELITEVRRTDQKDERITFDIECNFSDEDKGILADILNRSSASPFLDNDLKHINMEAIRTNVSDFLEKVFSGIQKLKSANTKQEAAHELLTATENVRFSAQLEGDIIGGFSRSTMTPGKRALFALTLMLSESDGAWPLLIDQPEDDLDSRSIYGLIVPYLLERKRERQIIMVSHNANLVIGADSEQIIVANKHGDDRKNKDSRMFEYVTGALENSKEKDNSDIILSSCGIREHACEILDGGEEAFEKRKEKYRL